MNDLALILFQMVGHSCDFFSSLHDFHRDFFLKQIQNQIFSGKRCSKCRRFVKGLKNNSMHDFLRPHVPKNIQVVDDNGISDDNFISNC